ncbi:MAG: hypothetical protein ACRD0P_10650 [Stackebrandtia sp.]
MTINDLYPVRSRNNDDLTDDSEEGCDTEEFAVDLGDLDSYGTLLELLASDAEEIATWLADTDFYSSPESARYEGGLLSEWKSGYSEFSTTMENKLLDVAKALNQFRGALKDIRVAYHEADVDNRDRIDDAYAGETAVCEDPNKTDHKQPENWFHHDQVSYADVSVEVSTADPDRYFDGSYPIQPNMILVDASMKDAMAFLKQCFGDEEMESAAKYFSGSWGGVGRASYAAKCFQVCVENISRNAYRGMIGLGYTWKGRASTMADVTMGRICGAMLGGEDAVESVNKMAVRSVDDIDFAAMTVSYSFYKALQLTAQALILYPGLPALVGILPDDPNDNNTQALFDVPFNDALGRLADVAKGAGSYTVLASIAALSEGLAYLAAAGKWQSDAMDVIEDDVDPTFDGAIKAVAGIELPELIWKNED